MKYRERIERFTPVGWMGPSEEIRGAVVSLASPAAGYVTGFVVAVGGGSPAWWRGRRRSAA